MASWNPFSLFRRAEVKDRREEEEEAEREERKRKELEESGIDVNPREATDLSGYILVSEEQESLQKLASHQINFAQFSGSDWLEKVSLHESLHESSMAPPGPEVMTVPQHAHSRPKGLHITFLTIGTRGDVQPFIAICKRLQEDGQVCRIATHLEYKSFVETHGIEFRPVGGNPAKLIDLCVRNGMFSVSFIREGLANFSGFIQELLDTAWDACQGTDVLVGTPSSMAGIHIAEALKIPFFYGFPFPWTATREFRHPFAYTETEIGSQLGTYFNSLAGGRISLMSYFLIDKVLWAGISPFVNKWRYSKLNLRPISYVDDRQVPVLYAFSSHIVPHPPDWSRSVFITGYWFLDEPNHDWTPPQELVDFIAGGPPPIYIGFGSVVVDDPEGMMRTICRAVTRAGVRAVISKGWSGRAKEIRAGSIPDGPEPEAQAQEEEDPEIDLNNIFVLGHAPHDWLFPQMGGVVHHGGAGTTAAALRFGKPTAIKPFFGDQYFWAERVTKLKVGVTVKSLTVEDLGDALVSLSQDQELRSNAEELGKRLFEERGLDQAANCLYYQLGVEQQRIQEGTGQQAQEWAYQLNPKTEAEDGGFVSIEHLEKDGETERSGPE